jgi:hypothetical protein
MFQVGYITERHSLSAHQAAKAAIRVGPDEARFTSKSMSLIGACCSSFGFRAVAETACECDKFVARDERSFRITITGKDEANA